MFQANLSRGLGKKQSPNSPVKSGGAFQIKPPVKQQVKPFTKESLERLENKTVQLVRDYGFQPRRKVSVEDGSVLPPKFEPFPSMLYGRPLEEIDNFIYDEDFSQPETKAEDLKENNKAFCGEGELRRLQQFGKSLVRTLKSIGELNPGFLPVTFCVVSKRFRKNYIHRFTATRSFFIFSPWNTVRQTCIFLSTNQYFDYIVMTTILLNCVFLAMTEPVEEAEFVFLAIYTAEMIIKSVAKGFILNKYTYLRNPWNWLDFVVITSGYATIGMEVGNLAGLRTFRVLRALKTVSIMPGLKTIINALLHSFKQLAEVMTLTIFCLMVFALFALQVYMGELRNKCVLTKDSGNVTHLQWIEWVTSEENWLLNDDGSTVLCGNTTGSRHCPKSHVCLRVGGNPNHGFTNFDNFLWSMLTTFQLITLDYWENVYNMVIGSCGPISVVFFTVVVFFGSFYLINLMLAVVALSYEEEAEITQEEKKKDLVDYRDESTFSFDPSNLDVKQLDKNKKRKIDSRKGVLLSSYTRKKTRRKKGKAKDGQGSNGNGGGTNVQSPSPSPKPRPPLRPRILSIATPGSAPGTQEQEDAGDSSTSRLASGPPKRGAFCARQTSNNSAEGNFRESSLDDSGVVDDHEEGDPKENASTEQAQKLESVTIAVKTKEKEIRVLKCNGVSPGQDPKNLLKEHLYSLPPEYLSHIVVLDDLVDRNCKSCISCCVDYDGWLRCQNCLYKFVRDPLFELLITICIILNTMFLAMEHHGMSESVRQALDIGNKVFTSIFTFECFLKLLALSKEFFDCGWNIFDLIIVSASLLDLSIEIVDGLTVLRGLRLLRVLKLAQSWTTMKVLLSIIISTIGALGNLTFVLVIVIYIFAVIGMQLFSKDYTSDKFAPDPVPRWNFNDFFHSFMMIFRILCGEWIEPLWDCMRAEEVEGAKTCFFIFLPALVMGNFMVLNLFLALLLNSFNSEELKNKKEEVGEDSKLTRSFERIRSIVGKKKPKRKYYESKGSAKLDDMVQQVMKNRKGERSDVIMKNGFSDIEETVLDGENLKITTEEQKSTMVNLFSPESLSFRPEPRFSVVSQDLSKQLEQVLEEKIKSLHSSSDQLLEDDGGEFGFLGMERPLSHIVMKDPGSRLLDTQADDFSSIASNEFRSLLLPGEDENPSSSAFPPSTEISRLCLSEFRDENAERKPVSSKFPGCYLPRPSDSQLTFITPPDSNSCSSREKTNRKIGNNGGDGKRIFASQEESARESRGESFPLREQTEHVIEKMASTNGTAPSSEDSSRCSKTDAGKCDGFGGINVILKENNKNLKRKGKGSQISIKSNGSGNAKVVRSGETDRDLSTTSQHTTQRSVENLNSSSIQKEDDFQDLSASESEPVYSPPSHSSLSTFDKRYSAVFSPPSDTNFSFSLPIDKIYESTFSPPTITDSSFGQRISDANKSASPNDTIVSSPSDKKFSPETEKKVIPERNEETEDIPEICPPDGSSGRDDPSSEVEMVRTARDKRLSYFLAIQQGESKDSATGSPGLERADAGEAKGRQPDGERAAPVDRGRKPWHALVSYVDELTVGGRRDSQGRYVDGMGEFSGFGRGKRNRTPQDCFPQHCFQRSVCCDHFLESDLGKKWNRCRTYVLSVVDTPVFEWVILVLIFSSSITLCFEDIYLDNNKMLKNILYWTNFGFCALFSIEMLLKWLALGFWKYFTSFWTILDFIIVFVSIFSLLIEENENLKVLRSLRTLRALRPLRAISRWQGMRIVVNALMYAIPSIFNVLLVCLVFWLIFSIMGVQFFGGKFFKCIDEEGDLLPIHIVNDKYECLYKNYTWINSKITFDHVGQAYLALFQVATFEGWMEVMADAVDARGEDLQPQREANLYAYLYFVIFIVCGSFFTLNLFIGVIIDNFNMLKKKYEGGVLEMFLTESQKHYYTAMKKLGRKKPQKVIHRPLNKFLAIFYDLSNSRRFEIAIFILIFLNMVTMAIEHYDQPHAIFFVLEVSNAFFTTVFGLEAIVKIVGLRYHYFTVPWNVFDFLLVLASILGILMEDIMIDFPISPTLLRVVRVFRIGRILRLIKAAKGIRKLLFALVVSLPALFNIGALLSLITFIYAIIGMSVFGHVKQQGALDDMVNFETFGRSMQLLFRLMTSAGWNDVLESLMIQPPDCDPHLNQNPNGDCGYPLLAITYFTSFIIINYMIVINMYIAIILENFNQAHQEEEIGIVEDDLEMFYIRWSKYDPHATQFIRFNQLSDFIASLDPPLGIPKPNIVALVSFNLPIARGNKIHCLDILHALVKHVLGHVEETDEFKKLQDQMDIKFKKQFPTRKELEIVSSTRIWKRQDKAARLIQKTFLEYLKNKREQEKEQMELEYDVNQTSSPGGGWQGKLSAFLHVHRGSRASSRKSSRTSDASDISELGGPWLNLPLLLLSGTQASQQDENEVRGEVSIKVSEASPNDAENDTVKKLASFPTQLLTPRLSSRRNNLNFLQRRSSARERRASVLTSPRLLRRSSVREPAAARQNVPSPKDRDGSGRDLGQLVEGKDQALQKGIENVSAAKDQAKEGEVNILVTEPSPQSPNAAPYPSTFVLPVERNRTAFAQSFESTVVQVHVHKELEENNSSEHGS